MANPTAVCLGVILLYFGTFAPATVTFTDAVMDWRSLFRADNINKCWSQFIGSFFFAFDSQNVKALVKVPKENDGEEVSCLHHPHALKTCNKQNTIIRIQTNHCQGHLHFLPLKFFISYDQKPTYGVTQLRC